MPEVGGKGGREGGREGGKEIGIRERVGIKLIIIPPNHHVSPPLPPSLPLPPFPSIPTIKSSPCSSFSALTMSLLSSFVLPKSHKLASMPRYNPPSRPPSFPSTRLPPARATCRSRACREGKDLMVPGEGGGREEVEEEAEVEEGGGWTARPQRERKRRRLGAVDGAGGGGMPVALVKVVVK